MSRVCGAQESDYPGTVKVEDIKHIQSFHGAFLLQEKDMERIVRLKEEYRGFVGEEYFRIGDVKNKSGDEREIYLTPLMQEAILAYRRNEEIKFGKRTFI